MNLSLLPRLSYNLDHLSGAGIIQLNGPAVRAVSSTAFSSVVALALLTACGPAQQSGEPEKKQNLSQQDSYEKLSSL